MAKYKVIALNVGGNNNKVFYLGETVDSSNFPKGRAEELVSQDFLKPIAEKKESSKKMNKKND